MNDYNSPLTFNLSYSDSFGHFKYDVNRAMTLESILTLLAKVLKVSEPRDLMISKAKSNPSCWDL